MQFEFMPWQAYNGNPSRQNNKHPRERPAMAMSDQQERRRYENRCLSLLVDLGVTYRRTLGDSVAWAFFRGSDISHTVVQRVMSNERARRLTDWERQAMRLAEQREQRERPVAANPAT
jgi:hypothetical protein